MSLGSTASWSRRGRGNRGRFGNCDEARSKLGQDEPELGLDAFEDGHRHLVAAEMVGVGWSVSCSGSCLRFTAGWSAEMMEKVVLTVALAL